MMTQQEYLKLTTKEDRLAAIAEAPDVEELFVMWRAWESRGLSRKGQIYGAVLARKVELGAKLTASEKRALGDLVRRLDENEGLPPIEGRMDW